MTDRTTQAIKAFWFPIIMSIVGAMLSFSGYMLTQNVQEMNKNIASISIQMGILGEKYYNIDKTIDYIQATLQKSTQDLNQCMVRMYNVESRLKDHIERENRK